MSELAFAEAVKEQLRPSGEVQLLYITANFEPFSSHSRPDLLFIATNEPTVCYFVELRFGRQKAHTKTSIEVLPEHRTFVAEDVDYPTVRFAFATDEEVEDSTTSGLRARGDDIRIFSGVTSPQDLADRILRWSRLSVRT